MYPLAHSPAPAPHGYPEAVRHVCVDASHAHPPSGQHGRLAHELP